MLARTALARLRAQAPRSSARDVARISRQLAHTYLTSSTTTSQLAIAPAAKSFRAYATATRTKPKPKPKPKAKATTKKSSAKKPVKKTAKKPAKKRVVKKPAKKVAAKKPAAPKRRGLTDRQKLLKKKAEFRATITKLKEAALEEPKKLPFTPWTLYIREVYRDGPEDDRTAPEVAKRASVTFKNMSSSERERLQNKADENKRLNRESYIKWRNSLTPQQIWEANKARSLLKRRLPIYRKAKIQDDRLVKAPKSPFLLYYIEFMKAAGNTVTVVQGAKKAAEEFRAMPASQKQKYVDGARQEQQRYLKEIKSIYGVEPSPSLKSAATA